MGFLKKLFGGKVSRDPEELYHRALKLFDQDRFKDAANYLEETVNIKPTSAVYFTLGATYSRIAGEFGDDENRIRLWAEKSKNAFSKAVDIDRQDGALEENQLVIAKNAVLAFEEHLAGTEVVASTTTDALEEEFLKAVAWRDIEKISYCIDKGADINVINELGDTSLIEASMNNDIDIVKLLLKRGANPDFKGKGGYTALITACVVGQYDSVKALLEEGANIDITEERGLIALDFAEDRGYDEIVNLLLEAGATRSDDASSPCCWSCVNASETPDKKLVCTLDFQNVKAVGRNHLCSAYEKRAE